MIRHRRYRGFTLTELTAALALITLCGALASKVLLAVLATGQNVQKTSASSTVVSRVAERLRRDVERADRVQTEAVGIRVGEVLWRVDGQTVTRQSGDQVTHYDWPASESPLRLKLWTQERTVCFEAGSETGGNDRLSFATIIGREKP